MYFNVLIKYPYFYIFLSLLTLILNLCYSSMYLYCNDYFILVYFFDIKSIIT